MKQIKCLSQVCLFRHVMLLGFLACKNYNVNYIHFALRFLESKLTKVYTILYHFFVKAIKVLSTVKQPLLRGKLLSFQRIQRKSKKSYNFYNFKCFLLTNKNAILTIIITYKDYIDYTLIRFFLMGVQCI